ncbi:hypothetical protein PMAYCL1PPCAC_07946, partial [Pristionchus mayeri]
LQVSPDAVALFILFYRIFDSESIGALQVKASALGICAQEWEHFLHWASARMTIRGDVFCPIIFPSKLRKLVASTAAVSTYPDLLTTYDRVVTFIYSDKDAFVNKIREDPQSFCSIVNKQLTSSFSALVEKADELFKRLPWDRAYDRETPLPSFEVHDVFATVLPYQGGHYDVSENRAVILSNIFTSLPLNMNMRSIRREDKELCRIPRTSVVSCDDAA